MTELFREGGPHRTHRLSDDQFEMSIRIPTDADGLLGRECPTDDCSPAYFKIKLGTGLTGQKVTFCPYCRTEAAPDQFTTKGQLKYARETVETEAAEGVQRMLGEALGLDASGRRRIGGGMLSIDISMEKRPTPPVFPPLEDELRRDLTCPACGLAHAVFGLATWCPDCGKDIFLTHVQAEIAVVRRMLESVDSRRRELGARVAARDLENALEDAVSIFEAVLKALLRRYLRGKASEEEIEKSIRRSASYQDPISAAEGFGKLTGIKLDAKPIADLAKTFSKRHPIAHNLGVVDRRYLERARSGELEGREVHVTASEIEEALRLVEGIVRSAHEGLFPDPPETEASSKLSRRA